MKKNVLTLTAAMIFAWQGSSFAATTSSVLMRTYPRN